MNNSIFITYNPQSELERTLAIRLHTIGAVNGFQMYLPDRYNGVQMLDPETKYGIQNSAWFILFATRGLSPIVRSEIDYALSVNRDPSRIIIIYDASTQGRTLRGLEHCTEIFFDPRKETSDQVVGRIVAMIGQESARDQEKQKLTQKLQQTQVERNGLAALLGVGLGLFALSILSDESETEEKKKTPAKKTGKSRKARK